MRRRSLLFVALLLALTPSASAASLMPVHGDVDYLETGRVEGFVVSDLGFVLHSGATPEGEPTLRQFLFRAQQVDVLTVRDYEDRYYLDGPVPVDMGSTLNNLGSGPSGDVQEVLTGVSIKIVSTTPEWDFLLFSPRGEAPTTEGAEFRALGAGAYSMANSAAGSSILGAEVPRSAALRTCLAGADVTDADQLRLSSRFLSSEVRGTFNLLLYGASFRADTEQGAREFVTGRHTVTETGPLGVPVEREVNDALLLRVRGGSFRLLHEGPGLDVYAPQFLVRGRLLLADATGTLAWQSGPSRIERSALQLEGELRLAALGAPRPDGEGQSYGPLRIHGQVVGAPGPQASPLLPMAAAAAVGVGAAALGFVPGVRRLLFAFVGLFSMVGKEEALHHAARNQLLEHVRTNPGLTLSAAQRELGLGWGTIGYHVAVLERLGLLVTKRAGGKRLLFAQGQSRLADPRVWGALQNPSARLLYDAHFQHGEPLTATRAAQTLACTSQYAGRLLRRLASVGLVEARGNPHRALYAPTALLLDLGGRLERVILTVSAAQPVAVPTVAAVAMAPATHAPGRLTV